MKLIKCIVRPECTAEATDALERIGVSGLTVTDVRGRGSQTRPTGRYRGVDYADLTAMSMIDVVATDDLVDDVVRAVLDYTRTGPAGDGKIFVMAVEEGYTIRTRQPDRP
jgi:nitrogen regulatory protein PII